MSKNRTVDFLEYVQRKIRMDRVEDLLFEQQEHGIYDGLVEMLKNNYGRNYSSQEVDAIADEILNLFGLRGKNYSIPIIKITKAFGFKAYEDTLESDLSGNIHINGDTTEKYGHDKVIMVNEKDSLQHQRFVLAHEFAHYLFDFLGNPKYADISIKFEEPYKKNQHETEKEKRANRFAAALLMPEDIFINQYNYVRSVSSNRLLTLKYLSKFFETTEESIAKRIAEVIG